MPHNVCICVYHENVNLLLEVLSNPLNTFANHRALLQKLCCDTENEQCMYGECEMCKDKTLAD